MTFKKPFTDLEFRGTRWYLAEEVDRKLEAVKEWHENVKMDPDDRYRLEKILEAEG